MPLHSLTPLPGGATLGRWYLTETPAALWPLLTEAAAYAPLLPARADGPRQAQWLAGRVLVQRMLLAAGPAPLPRLRNDEAGRPWLTGAGPQPAVSLSHSGAWVAALLAPPGSALGVDVEVVRDKARRIARKFLNDEELVTLEKISLPPGICPADQELHSLLWSAKETLYKLADRRGLIFRDNLLLDLPAGPWPLPGALPARLRLAGGVSRHQICYLRPAAGYVLTYSYEPNRGPA